MTKLKWNRHKVPMASEDENYHPPAFERPGPRQVFRSINECFRFGRHAGKKLRRVLWEDKGYISWALKKDVISIELEDVVND